MAGPSALVVGGTGPTGPFVVNGLIERGYQVTIFHRGTHEVPEIPPEVTHIHGDPHFPETIDAALGRPTFDVTVAAYGRLRHVAAALAGRTGRFLAVGGVAVYRGLLEPELLTPPGMPVPVGGDRSGRDRAGRGGVLGGMVRTEDAVFEHHPEGTLFRYPYVYGPYQIIPREWSVVRRLLDGRRRLLLPDAGLRLETHGWAGNLAHSVLLALDQPEAAAGRRYNCGDLEQLDLRQVVLTIAEALDCEVELIAVPWDVAGPARAAVGAGHQVPHADGPPRHPGRARLHRRAAARAEAMARTARWYVDNLAARRRRWRSSSATPSTTRPRTA